MLTDNEASLVIATLQMAGKDSSQMFGHIVWTYSLTRLAVLVGQSIKFNEPVLMIGDTGQVLFLSTSICLTIYFVCCLIYTGISLKLRNAH